MTHLNAKAWLAVAVLGGAASLHTRRNHSLLAGLGVPVDLRGHVGPDHALPHEERSSPPRASDERRSDGGKATGAEVHHGGIVAGDILVVVAFCLITLVYREKPYALVCHPMYASASLYLLGTPLALGSYWGLVAVVATVPFLIWRLVDEERLLASQLP
jgi:hypothetical protein